MPDHDFKMIFAENLKRARSIRCLSMKELSQRMQQDAVTPTALSYYENGKRCPTSAHLLALSRALDFPVDFFTNPAIKPLDPATLSFRTLASTPVRVRASIAATTQDVLRRYQETLVLSGSGIPSVSPVPDMKIASGEDADRAAEALRTAWNLGVDPIKDVVDLLERNGFAVLSWKMPMGVSGFCGIWDGFRFVACNAEQSPFRRRSTLLREIAHLLFGCTDEKLAQRFAGAFLLPRESFAEVWGHPRKRCPSTAELLLIKGAFGASMSSIVVRAVQLGLLPSSAMRSFFLWHKRKEKEQGDDSREFREVPSLFRSRVYALLQDERITLSKGATLLGEPIESVRRTLAPA